MRRPVHIRSVMNGYIVDVGCQTLVFQSLGDMLSELRRYLDRPEDVEKEYVARFGMAVADAPTAERVNVQETAGEVRGAGLPPMPVSRQPPR